MRISNLFWNSKPVVDDIARKTRRVFGKFGAFVRREARKKIRAPKKRKAIDGRGRSITVLLPSEPGEAPRTPTKRYKNTILYDYKPADQSLIIGPKRTKSNAAETLEHGGTVRARERVEVQGRGGDGRFAAKRVILGEEKTIQVEPRPHMRPAFEAKLPQLPKLWRDAER